MYTSRRGRELGLYSVYYRLHSALYPESSAAYMLTSKAEGGLLSIDHVTPDSMVSKDWKTRGYIGIYILYVYIFYVFLSVIALSPVCSPVLTFYVDSQCLLVHV